MDRIPQLNHLHRDRGCAASGCFAAVCIRLVTKRSSGQNVLDLVHLVYDVV